jgi:cell division septal protein FtsQ
MKTAMLRGAIVFACAAVLVIAAAFSPIALRSINAFSVQSVEVNGLRYMSADMAVAAAGITRDDNVFDDPAPWREALLMHPLVADVRVQRRLPGMLVLHITEAVPVAFARTPELRAISANGRVLPTDPARDDLDLPVLMMRSRVSGQGRAVDVETLSALRFLAEVERVDRELIGWISEIGTHGDAVRLVLRSAADADVFVPANPEAERLRELASTLAELATPAAVSPVDGVAADADLTRVRTIDVRYQDQIVVSLRKGKS